MPGPAPKSDAARRRRNAPMANTIKLPSEGREGAPPSWPFGGTAPKIWAELWSTPQAVAWERLGWSRVVARYCRVLLLAESPESMTAALLGEVRQLEDRLGLSPMSMLRLRWEVVSDEVTERREERKPKKPRALVAVDDAVARS